jgi:hypothetical protein
MSVNLQRRIEVRTGKEANELAAMLRAKGHLPIVRPCGNGNIVVRWR